MKTLLQKRDSKFKNMTECWIWFFNQIKNKNIKPLYAGLNAKLYQTISNSAIKFMIYEKILYFVYKLFKFVAHNRKKAKQATKVVT